MISLMSSAASYTVAFLLIRLISAQEVQIGQPCNLDRNRLSSTTHQFFSDCERKAFCDPVDRVCKPKGCRSEEFPFGSRPEDILPPMCPSGTFCPDEEDQCLPLLAIGENCQLNRDDQCQPPPNAQELGNDWNRNGAICLKFACFWANSTLDQPCVVDNTAYTGYRADGSEFATIVSRDNCISPGLWCNAQTSRCERSLEIGETCAADKMCKSHNCGLENKCKEPEGTELFIALWQYIATGIGIVALIVGTLFGLFVVHRRQRAQNQREVREYYHEQMTYRSSIIALHTAARDRTSSIFSGSRDSYSFDEHGTRYSYSDDGSQRPLMRRGSNDTSYRHSRLRQSTSFDDRDNSDDENDQGKRLLGNRQSFSQARMSDSDNETPRQSFDYAHGSGTRNGGYDAVPLRQSVDLPHGAANPNKNIFKDPWET